jgi:FkbM family methyltransferase
MTTARAAIRQIIDTHAPSVSRLYRHWRDDQELFHPPMPTRYGFTLVGLREMERGDFEPNEIEVFLRYLESASICIDIGANVGLYTCLAARRGRYAIAIEPLPLNVQLLFKNLISNGIENVEVYPVGLSAAPGIQPFYGTGTTASLLTGWAGSGLNPTSVVPVTTLDLLVGARFEGQQLMIKLDVEGAEHLVLRGASRLMTLSPKPHWLVEISLGEHLLSGRNDDFCRTFELFWQHGYRSSIAAPGERYVGPQDVHRWVAQGSVDFGSNNYLFVHGTQVDAS